MNPKAKTLIERFGFVDADRNQTHDEIQLWVYQNLDPIFKGLGILQPYKNFIFKIDLISLEKPISSGSHIVGFLDVLVSVGKYESGVSQNGVPFSERIDQLTIGIEIKTRIESIGELLRQINFYRNSKTCDYWIVVSPDKAYQEVLKKQGIYFHCFGIAHAPNKIGVLKLN